MFDSLVKAERAGCAAHGAHYRNLGKMLPSTFLLNMTWDNVFFPRAFKIKVSRLRKVSNLSLGGLLTPHCASRRQIARGCGDAFTNRRSLIPPEPIAMHFCARVFIKRMIRSQDAS